MNSMLPIAAAARLGHSRWWTSTAWAARSPKLQMVTFTIGGVSASAHGASSTRRATSGILWRPSTNKWTEDICPCRLHQHAAARVAVALSTCMTAGRCKRVRRARHCDAQPGAGPRHSHGIKDCPASNMTPEEYFLDYTRRLQACSRARSPMCCARPAGLQLRQGRARGHRRRQGAPAMRKSISRTRT